MDDKQIIDKLKVLIEEGTKLGKVLYPSYSSSSYQNIEYFQEAKKWKGTALNLLKLRFGVGSDYFTDFSETIDDIYDDKDFTRENVKAATGVLGYVCDALENGFTENMFYKKEVELLTDLLDQAYEFLKNGFKLAAGIYGRIVLETTIRELANKSGIKEKSFEQLIIKLRQADIISKPFESSLRANYETGSWAAHGKEEFEKLSDNQKKEFLDFIRDKVLTLS